MNNIAISFASLVKSNNGFFKSDKQRDFLLSQCDFDEYVSTGSVGKNNFTITYIVDDLGVRETINRGAKSGKSEITWQRHVSGVLSDLDKKYIKKLETQIKKYETLQGQKQTFQEIINEMKQEIEKVKSK